MSGPISPPPPAAARGRGRGPMAFPLRVLFWKARQAALFGATETTGSSIHCCLFTLLLFIYISESPQIQRKVLEACLRLEFQSGDVGACEEGIDVIRGQPPPVNRTSLWDASRTGIRVSFPRVGRGGGASGDRMSGPLGKGSVLLVCRRGRRGCFASLPRRRSGQRRGGPASGFGQLTAALCLRGY